METAIRILTIFAGSGQLTIMFVASLLFIGLFYAVTRAFNRLNHKEQMEAETKQTEIQQKLRDIEFKIARQIEAKSLSHG